MTKYLFFLIVLINSSEGLCQKENFQIIFEDAQFHGGDEAMFNFIRDNVKYPLLAKEAGIQGKVYVEFIVNKDGSLSEIEIARGVHKTLDDEALRVVKLMPNWIPGEQRGKKVRFLFTLPINFKSYNGSW